jgi:hypothetical protein
MAKRGALPCFRVSGSVRFLASEIVKIESDEYLSAIVANTFEQLSPKERL